MKILMLHRQQSAVGYYRTWLPARHFAEKGHEVYWWETERSFRKMGHDQKARNKWFNDHGPFDIIWCDRGRNWEEIGETAGYRHFSPNGRLIVDFDDDFTCVPKWNHAHNEFGKGTIARESGLAHLKLAEQVTVSTDTLQNTFSDKAHRIRTLKNCIDPKDWQDLKVNPERAQDPHLRILYGGAAGHYGDLDPIREGLEAVIRNPPVPIRLICFGALPAWMHELSREFPGRLVSLPWATFKDYPQAIAWGGFDVSLAPLAEHPFNECKSNIKWLEAGIQGIPLLCSDVGPYKVDIPDGCACKVDNTPAQWSSALRALLKDKALRESYTKRSLKEVKTNWTIDQRGKEWDNIIETVSTLPRIETLEDTQLKAEPDDGKTTP